MCAHAHTPMYVNMHASNWGSLSSEHSLHPSLMHEGKRQVTIHEMFASRVHSYCQKLAARPRPPWEQELNTGKWFIGIASKPAPCKLVLCNNLVSPLSHLLTDFLGARRELWGRGDWWDFVQMAYQVPS